MPIYDRACAPKSPDVDACGWRRDDCYEPIVCDVKCPECGAETERVWRSSMSAGVIPDEYTKPWVAEHLGHEPVTIYSRSQLKREMDARGLQPFVRHTGEPGSDKSKHTSRWV
jgi:hypothetical protein